PARAAGWSPAAPRGGGGGARGAGWGAPAAGGRCGPPRHTPNVLGGGPPRPENGGGPPPPPPLAPPPVPAPNRPEAAQAAVPPFIRPRAPISSGVNWLARLARWPGVTAWLASDRPRAPGAGPHPGAPFTPAPPAGPRHPDTPP